MDLVEVLSFLFMLSTTELGRVRSLASLYGITLEHHLGLLHGKPERDPESDA